MTTPEPQYKIALAAAAEGGDEAIRILTRYGFDLGV
jgi:hypothetical protein